MHDDIPNTLPHQEWHAAAAIWLVDYCYRVSKMEYYISKFQDFRCYFLSNLYLYLLYYIHSFNNGIHTNKGGNGRIYAQKIRSVLYIGKIAIIYYGREYLLYYY